MKVIADKPSPEMYAPGLEIDCQCARCGSSAYWEDCTSCEDGFDGHDCGEDCCCCLQPEENVACEYCDGEGVFHRCMSDPEWCEANPLPGREGIKRGQIEWFTVKRDG